MAIKVSSKMKSAPIEVEMSKREMKKCDRCGQKKDTVNEVDDEKYKFLCAKCEDIVVNYPDDEEEIQKHDEKSENKDIVQVLKEEWEGKSNREKPKKEVKMSKAKKVKVEKEKKFGKVFTRIVTWIDAKGKEHQVFQVATDKKFFENTSTIKPLSFGPFAAHLIERMMNGEVEGPSLFEFTEKNCAKYSK